MRYALKITNGNLLKHSSDNDCEDIYSDINVPPFDKSAMNGYDCRSAKGYCGRM